MGPWSNTNYLQIAFSHGFSLPVARLVSTALDMAEVTGSLVVSPKMHNIAMMLLGSILLGAIVKRSRVGDSGAPRCALSAVVTERSASVMFFPSTKYSELSSSVRHKFPEHKRNIFHKNLHWPASNELRD